MLEEDFLKAIVKGDSQRVVRLLGQITNTGPLKDGRNALHLAAQYGNSDIVSVLLLSGLYDCNTPDS
ncbi:Ankyrin repeat domain-containing protein 6, partial [Sarracenia purpurea var. burkii]